MTMELVQGSVIDVVSYLNIGSGLLLTQDAAGIVTLDYNPASGLTQEQADARYVLKSGDVMTGTLTTRNVAVQAGYSVSAPVYLSTSGYASQVNFGGPLGMYSDSSTYRGGMTYGSGFVALQTDSNAERLRINSTGGQLTGNWETSANVDVFHEIKSNVGDAWLFVNTGRTDYVGVDFKYAGTNHARLGAYGGNITTGLSAYFGGVERQRWTSAGGTLYGAWSTTSTHAIGGAIFSGPASGRYVQIQGSPSVGAADFQVEFYSGSGAARGGFYSDGSALTIFDRLGGARVAVTTGGGLLYGAWGIPVTTGSTAAPSLYITGDSDTGLTSVGANDLRMVTGGGAQQVIIEPSGFFVRTGSAEILRVLTGGGGTLYGNDWTLEGPSSTYFHVNTTLATGDSGVRLNRQGTTRWYIYNLGSADSLDFYSSSGITVMRLNNGGGGLLYGAWTTTGKHEVLGAWGVMKSLLLSTDGTEANYRHQLYVDGSNNFIHYSRGYGDVIKVNYTGGGTLYGAWNINSVTDTAFEVQSTGTGHAFVFIHSGRTDYGGVEFRSGGERRGIIGAHAGDLTARISAYFGTTERLRWDATGGTLYGTWAVVSGALAVSSNNVAVSPSGYDIKIRSNTSLLGIHTDNAAGIPTLEFGTGGGGAWITNPDTDSIVVRIGGNDRAAFSNTGGQLYGAWQLRGDASYGALDMYWNSVYRGAFYSDSNGIGLLDSGGNWGARITPGANQGGTLFNSWETTGNHTADDFILSSDRALKHDLSVIRSALDKVDALTGYTFRYNDEPVRRRAGVIMQDVQEVLPEAVVGRGVSYDSLVPLLVEAVKELRQEVRALRGQ